MKTSLKRKLTLAVAYTLAVLIGVGSAVFITKKTAWSHANTRIGPWSTNLLAGNTNADMYTRASIAINALLALARNETMYFVAHTDSAGRPLKAQCNYRISGEPPQARWWSITAYADDLFLFDAPNQQYSLNGDTAILNGQGQFVFSVGRTPIDKTMAWLPTTGTGGIYLTLRLYNPQATIEQAPHTLSVPRIERQGDC